MPAKRLLDPGELALRVRDAHDAGGAQALQAVVGVVGDVEVGAGRGLEALHAAPRHVLDRQEGAVVEQDEVEIAVHDDCAVERVDDAREHRVARGDGGVDVEHAVGAFFPFAYGRVDGFLDFGAVEVYHLARGKIAKRAGEAEHVPQQRTRGCDLVDIEARVGQEDGVDDVVPDGAAFVGRGAGWLGQLARRREGQVGVDVVGVAAFVGARVDIGHEGLVEVEEAFPAVDEGDGGNYIAVRSRST